MSTLKRILARLFLSSLLFGGIFFSPTESICILLSGEERDIFNFYRAPTYPSWTLGESQTYLRDREEGIRNLRKEKTENAFERTYNWLRSSLSSQDSDAPELLKMRMLSADIWSEAAKDGDLNWYTEGNSIFLPFPKITPREIYFNIAKNPRAPVLMRMKAAQRFCDSDPNVFWEPSQESHRYLKPQEEYQWLLTVLKIALDPVIDVDISAKQEAATTLCNSIFTPNHEKESALKVLQEVARRSTLPYEARMEALETLLSTKKSLNKEDVEELDLLRSFIANKNFPSSLYIEALGILATYDRTEDTASKLLSLAESRYLSVKDLQEITSAYRKAKNFKNDLCRKGRQLLIQPLYTAFMKTLRHPSTFLSQRLNIARYFLQDSDRSQPVLEETLTILEPYAQDKELSAKERFEAVNILCSSTFWYDDHMSTSRAHLGPILTEIFETESDAKFLPTRVAAARALLNNDKTIWNDSQAKSLEKSQEENPERTELVKRAKLFLNQIATDRNAPLEERYKAAKTLEIPALLKAVAEHPEASFSLRLRALDDLTTRGSYYFAWGCETMFALAKDEQNPYWVRLKAANSLSTKATLKELKYYEQILFNTLPKTPREAILKRMILLEEMNPKINQNEAIWCRFVGLLASTSQENWEEAIQEELTPMSEAPAVSDSDVKRDDSNADEYNENDTKES